MDRLPNRQEGTQHLSMSLGLVPDIIPFDAAGDFYAEDGPGGLFDAIEVDGGDGGDGPDEPAPGGMLPVPTNRTDFRRNLSVHFARIAPEPETDREGNPLFDRDGKPCIDELYEQDTEDEETGIINELLALSMAEIARFYAYTSRINGPTHVIVKDDDRGGKTIHRIPIVPAA